MDKKPGSRFRKFIVDLKKFDVLQTLESGAFGSVISVKDHKTGIIYAAKVKTNTRKWLIPVLWSLTEITDPKPIQEND